MQVRAKTFVAVGHETANKGEHGKNLRRDTMDANLLANMELGIHADAAPGRQTSDLVSTLVLCSHQADEYTSSHGICASARSQMTAEAAQE